MFLKEVSFAHPSWIFWYSRSSNIGKYFLQFKITLYNIWYILTGDLWLWWQSWIFSTITPVFSVTWSFRNHSNILTWWILLIFWLSIPTALSSHQYVHMSYSWSNTEYTPGVWRLTNAPLEQQISYLPNNKLKRRARLWIIWLCC